MPLKATDYAKTIIYHFVCEDDTITNTYVGSTTDFSSRKSKHKKACIDENNKEYNQKKYTLIRENGGWENWKMMPLEEYPCENSIQARMREQYWINTLKSDMNSDRAYRTEEDKKADARKNDLIRQDKTKNDPIYREKRLSNRREGWERNKDKLNEKRVNKYKTEPVYRAKKLSVSHKKYEKTKEVLLPKLREEYKKKKDELNEIRRNRGREQKDIINAYTRWNNWKKKPYESIFCGSCIQKLLK